MELLVALFFLICSALAADGGVSEETVPLVGYDVAKATISRCRYSSPEATKRVENHRELVSLHSSRTHITLLSSNSGLSLSSLGLSDCMHVARVSDIVNSTDELSNYHTVMRRSTQSLIGVHWFQSYHNLTSIYHWYRLLSNQYPSRVRIVESIGTTQQGRNIMAVHVSDWSNGAATSRPKIYLQCLMHAREWITGPVCMYTAWNLATAALSDVAEVLRKVEFIIVPVLNPDGYELSQFMYPTYRFWRKNVARYTSSVKCAGVDLNRNFNIKWDQGEAGDPCGETYRGPSAASEKEVQAVVKYLKTNAPVVGGLDFHSFSQIIVYPYGWTTNAPNYALKLKQAAEQFATQAGKLGRKYTVHQMGSIYVATGTFGDWLFSDEFRDHNTDKIGAQVTPVPLTVELRPVDDDTKTYTSFMLPPAEILPSCQEMFPAIVNFAAQLVTIDKHTRP